MQPVDRNRITRLLVVIRKYRRILLHDHVSGELIPPVVVPGLWIESGIVARAHWIVPTPTRQVAIMRMIRRQHPRGSMSITVRLLKHGELIRIAHFIFVNTRLHMPAREVSAIRPRKGAGAEPADRCSLPVPIIDIAGVSL